VLGEVVTDVAVTERGLTGDQLRAVRDPDGKPGSGKNTRRFRRMPGLSRLRAYAAEPAPVIELPDGRRFTADDPAGHRAPGKVLGRTVTLVPEGPVPHHDEGPVSLVTTASLRHLTELSGDEPGGGGTHPLRFRANLLLDVPGSGFPEDNWPGRQHDLLKTLAEHHELTLGVFATVERPGRIATVSESVGARPCPLMPN
jgi:uncharacterized protein YcbX